MMAAVEQAFQQRFGMDAGWAHNVLFISGDCCCSLGLPLRWASRLFAASCCSVLHVPWA